MQMTSLFYSTDLFYIWQSTRSKQKLLFPELRCDLLVTSLVPCLCGQLFPSCLPAYLAGGCVGCFAESLTGHEGLNVVGHVSTHSHGKTSLTRHSLSARNIAVTCSMQAKKKMSLIFLVYLIKSMNSVGLLSQWNHLSATRTFFYGHEHLTLR